MSQPAREKSGGLLLNRIAARAPLLPVVVTGDFNTGESNPVTQAVAKVLRDTFRVVHPQATEVGTANQFKLGTTMGDKIDYGHHRAQTHDPHHAAFAIAMKPGALTVACRHDPSG